MQRPLVRWKPPSPIQNTQRVWPQLATLVARAGTVTCGPRNSRNAVFYLGQDVALELSRSWLLTAAVLSVATDDWCRVGLLCPGAPPHCVPTGPAYEVPGDIQPHTEPITNVCRCSPAPTILDLAQCPLNGDMLGHKGKTAPRRPLPALCALDGLIPTVDFGEDGHAWTRVREPHTGSLPGAQPSRSSWRRRWRTVQIKEGVDAVLRMCKRRRSFTLQLLSGGDTAPPLQVRPDHSYPPPPRRARRATATAGKVGRGAEQGGGRAPPLPGCAGGGLLGAVRLGSPALAAVGVAVAG